jgi:hypothetical protein
MNRQSSWRAIRPAFTWPAFAVVTTFLLGFGGAAPTQQVAQPQEGLEPAAFERFEFDYGAGPIRRAGDAPAMPASTLAFTPRTVPAVGDPLASTLGMFGEAFTWPLIPIHVALLPDGRVMAFGTDQTGNVKGSALKYAVWNPADATTAFLVLPNTTATQIFCATQVLGAAGQLMIFGGTKVIQGSTGNGSSAFTTFDPGTNAVAQQSPMTYERWYASAVTMGNGEVAVLGGRIIGVGNVETGPATYAPYPRSTARPWVGVC